MLRSARFPASSLALGLGLMATGLPLSAAGAASLAPAPLAAEGRTKAELHQVLLVRRCWTRRGVAHCRWIDQRVMPYKWYDPNRYPTGSKAWWRAMDREGRGGFRSP
jgi:hypothetical protein